MSCCDCVELANGSSPNSERSDPSDLHYNQKILVRFIVVGAFILETLEKSMLQCLLDSILRFTEVFDTQVFVVDDVVQVYAASFNLYWLFLAKQICKKKGLL